MTGFCVTAAPRPKALGFGVTSFVTWVKGKGIMWIRSVYKVTSILQGGG